MQNQGSAGTSTILFSYLTTDPQVLGLVAWVSTAITLLGFGIAIWQIVEAKRAADAARDAALKLAQRVRSRELLAKLGDANNHLEAARNHVGSGSREIAALCLELSRGSIIEARQLSAGVAGDWSRLDDLIIRLREAERRLAMMTQPLQRDFGFDGLRFILRDASEILQQSAAQARYAYNVEES